MNYDSGKNFVDLQLPMETSPGAEIILNGKRYNYFAGTSYYSLHNNPFVINSAADALNKYGITSASSRGSFGTTKLMVELEQEVAAYFETESAAFLPSGFLTSPIALQVLNQQNLFDAVFVDEISHYSNQLAVKVTEKPVYRFAHLDPDDLESKIREYMKNGQRPLIVTDGIFPIYGKIAPINIYKEVALKYGGIIWIDDAHGAGVLGNNGRGTVEHFNLNNEKIFWGGTFSKAFGGFGGFIPGRKEFIEQIKNDNFFNGATPAPSAAAAANLTGLKILKHQQEKRFRLWNNARKMKTGLRNLGIDADDSNVPIAAWSLKTKSEMQKLVDELFKKNYLIQLINYVGAGNNGALRVVVFETHTEEQIDGLIDQLKRIL